MNTQEHPISRFLARRVRAQCFDEEPRQGHGALPGRLRRPFQEAVSAHLGQGRTHHHPALFQVEIPHAQARQLACAKAGVRREAHQQPELRVLRSVVSALVVYDHCATQLKAFDHGLPWVWRRPQLWL